MILHLRIHKNDTTPRHIVFQEFLSPSLRIHKNDTTPRRVRATEIIELV
ncbi:hypothetical protein [Mycoplasma marinum]